MKSVEQVIQGCPSPWAAAVELVRRFKSKGELPNVATRWLELLPDAVPTAGLAPVELDAVVELLAGKGGKAGGPTLERVARVVRSSSHGPPVGALVAVARGDTEENRRAALLSWAEGQPTSVRESFATEWLDDVETAWALMGTPTYPADPRCACGNDHAPPNGDLDSFGLFLLARRDQHQTADPREDEVLAALPVHLWLEDREAARLAARLIRAGIAMPRVVDRARQALRDPRLRGNAVWILSASGEAESVVSALAESIRAGADAPAVLREVVGDRVDIVWGGPFQGRGWSRKARPRVLLPLVRLMLDRGELPVLQVRALLQPSRHEPVGSEQEWVFVQEVLAEGLLDVAHDAAVPLERRRAAVEALGVLAPGGDGSWARALPKLREPALGESVRAALARWRDAPPVDIELAVEDALELASRPTPPVPRPSAPWSRS